MKLKSVTMPTLIKDAAFKASAICTIAADLLLTRLRERGKSRNVI